MCKPILCVFALEPYRTCAAQESIVYCMREITLVALRLTICVCTQACQAGFVDVQHFPVKIALLPLNGSNWHVSCSGKGTSEHLGIAEAAQKVQESLDASTNAVNESDANERKNRVKELFHAMDKDHNGKLDVGECRGNTDLWYKVMCNTIH